MKISKPVETSDDDNKKPSNKKVSTPKGDSLRRIKSESSEVCKEPTTGPVVKKARITLTESDDVADSIVKNAPTSDVSSDDCSHSKGDVESSVARKKISRDDMMSKPTDNTEANKDDFTKSEESTTTEVTEICEPSQVTHTGSGGKNEVVESHSSEALLPAQEKGEDVDETLAAQICNPPESPRVNKFAEADHDEGDGDDEGEPKSTSKKIHKRRRRSGGIDLDEDLLQKAEGAGAGSGDEDGERHHSSRAAAMVAKSRLSVTGTAKGRMGGSVGLETVAEESGATQTKLPAALLPKQWAMCDTCQKWRSIPGEVDASELPEQWHCSMNVWDDEHNDCNKDEEEFAEEPEEPSISTVDDGSSVRLSEGGGGRGRGRGGRGRGGGGRRGRRPLNREIVVDTVGDDEGVGGRRRRGRVPYGSSYADDEADLEIQQTSVLPPLENVTWVQCNKCSKWRKVPGRIDQKDLPDVWYCIMNTWAPEYAKCSVKEEVEEPTPLLPVPVGRVGSTGVGRGRYVRRGRMEEGVVAPAAVGPGGIPPKKVTQWVQCERKNCKKWRKIPGQVDLSALPEKWYCEMNIWDSERATCDGAEESDSEGEQPAHAGTTRQLILGNSKGPGTLSYRRLIFGTDGRIRPSYSEKNKNGYGMFSFTEVFRPSDADEYIMPTRRVGYWWSSLYDESGANYTSHSKAHRAEKKATAVAQDDQPDGLVPSGVEATKASFMRQYKRFSLIDTIGRLVESSGTCSLSGVNGHESSTFGKWGKLLKKSKKQTLQQRMRLAAEVVKSCLMMQAAEEGPTIEELLGDIYGTYFVDEEMEACRATLGLDELKETLYRLESSGDIEVLYDNEGKLSFRLFLQLPLDKSASNPYPGILSSSEASMDGTSLPLRMRKRKVRMGPVLPTAPYMSVAEASESVPDDEGAGVRSGTSESVGEGREEGDEGEQEVDCAGESARDSMDMAEEVTGGDSYGEEGEKEDEDAAVEEGDDSMEEQREIGAGVSEVDAAGGEKTQVDTFVHEDVGNDDMRSAAPEVTVTLGSDAVSEDSIAHDTSPHGNGMVQEERIQPQEEQLPSTTQPE